MSDRDLGVSSLIPCLAAPALEIFAQPILTAEYMSSMSYR
jgi:hypothetical protein